MSNPDPQATGQQDPTPENDIAPDVDEGHRFLDRVGGPKARWCLQTFDDDVQRRDQRKADAKAAGDQVTAEYLAKHYDERTAKQAGRHAQSKARLDTLATIRNGTLKHHGRFLVEMNRKRAGIFVTINETDGQGRHARNVTKVRALFVDLDGVPLEEAKAKLAEVGLVPHIVVQTSPGRWHLYFLVHDFPLDRFTVTQQRLIALLGSDQSVHDLPRVMRLPGFVHCKRDPFLVRILEEEDHEPYGVEAFDKLPPLDDMKSAAKAKRPRKVEGNGRDTGNDELTAAVERLSMVLGDGPDGGFNIVCPWESEHTTAGASSETVYWPARDGNKPGFKCQHHHCAKRSIKDFIAEVRRRDPTYDAYCKAYGRRGVPLGETGEPPLEVTYDDFLAFAPDASFIFLPDGALWSKTSINRRLQWKDNGPNLPATAPSNWLLSNKPVEQMTWIPGEPTLIRNRLLLPGGGWSPRPGATVFNLYRPPTTEPGDPKQATRWLDLVSKLFPDEDDLVIDWLAHRVQHPGIKVNHVLLLGGGFGIGKDTLLEPAIRAVGPWNSTTISPAQFVARFNGHLKSVLLRIAEARDSEHFDRYSFYDAIKLHGAAPPDTIRIDEKNRPEYDVANVVGIAITANRMSAFYIEPDDRRHAVAWSRCQRTDFPKGYFDDLYRWYHAEGFGHVAAYLRQHDLSHFNSKAPPRQTDAFHDIVSRNRASEDAEMADALDKLAKGQLDQQRPPVVTVAMVRGVASADFAEWLGERGNRRVIPHRFEGNDYGQVRNPDRRSGLWVINDQRVAIYGQKHLDRRTLLDEARALQERGGRRRP